MTLEEFFPEEKRLLEGSGFPEIIKDDMMRGALVYSVKSDQVRREGIKTGNSLRFKQIYVIAKIKEKHKNTHVSYVD